MVRIRIRIRIRVRVRVRIWLRVRVGLILLDQRSYEPLLWHRYRPSLMRFVGYLLGRSLEKSRE